VAICDLKRFVADYAGDDGISVPAEHPESGKKVAIIGSGPAGLTAAYYLRSLGHMIDIYDREEAPGGMLRYGIPAYRLPSEVLDRELKALETEGVTFHMNQPLDGDNGYAKLKSQGYDAVLIAAGTSTSKNLPIEGTDLDNVYPGLEFLRSARTSQEPKLQGKTVVIGGGNVAIDAAMTALRLGSRSVHLYCLESREEMPAHEWEIAQAEEEGIVIHPSWGPNLFKSGNGSVSGVEFMRCTQVFDEQNRFNPQYDQTVTETTEADNVIVTIGQQVDEAIFAGIDGLTKGPGGTVRVSENLSTGIDGVFAAGDVAKGPSSVIDAIAEGRRAADVIDIYLGGTGLDETVAEKSEINKPGINSTAEEFHQSRSLAAVSAPESRTAGFGLIQATLTEEAARAEAQRCMRCHVRLDITPAILPPEKWLPFSQEAVEAVPEVDGVFQLLDAEKKVIRISGTQNLKQSLTECLDNPGEAKWFVWEEDPMYTKRESELIQQHLQKYGELPGGGSGGDDLDDLF